jgi:hypothetical protein
MCMVLSGSVKGRIGSILATSIGPLLVMLDLAAVVIIKGNIFFGFGRFGGAFPSPIGIIGLVIWLLGASFLISRRFQRSRKRSTKTRSVFLKGRTGIKCYNCKRWIDASDVGYQKMITCSCGTNYNMFQDGPWDEISEPNQKYRIPNHQPPTQKRTQSHQYSKEQTKFREKGSGSSSASRKLKGNDRSRKRSAPPPRRR